MDKDGKKGRETMNCIGKRADARLGEAIGNADGERGCKNGGRTWWETIGATAVERRAKAGEKAGYRKRKQHNVNNCKILLDVNVYKGMKYVCRARKFVSSIDFNGCKTVSQGQG